MLGYLRVLLEGVLDGIDRFLNFRAHPDVNMAHIGMTHLVDVDYGVEQTVNALSRRCRGRHDGHSEHLAERRIVETHP